VQSKKQAHYIVAPLISLISFIYVFESDYAYLDEAHQLWYNKDTSNYNMFLIQGRFITGWMIQIGFGLIDSISELKYLRIFSLVGWIATILLWQYLANKWCSRLKLSKELPIVSAIILATGIPMTVYVGWASCMEMFLGFSLAIIASNLLFSEIFKREIVEISNWRIVLIIVLGLCSLFIYQTTFGAFLIPFFLYYFYCNKKFDKTVLIGIGFYIVISAIYYFLFKYSLIKMGINPSERTQLASNILKKISFLFSGPLPLGFSLNFPYNYHGIISQTIYPLLLLCMILSFIKENKKIIPVIQQVAIFFLFLFLMYISVLAVPENFASYRTVLVINLICGIAIFKAINSLLPKEKIKRIFSSLFCILLIGFAVNNYNRQFRIPLHYEYSKLRDEIEKNYKSGFTNILLIRPSENIFQKTHNIGNYKDELGIPSTYKDWTPEPLVRQIIYEISGNRSEASKINISQLSGSDLLSQKPSPNTTLIVMDSLLLKLKK